MTVRNGIIWLTVVCCLSTLGLAFAQNAAPAKVEPAAAAPADKSPPPKPLSGDVVPLKNANGETVPLLRTPLLEEVLAELAARRQRMGLEPLPWSVAEVALQGTADGDQAVLEATLKIELLANDKWVQVPLRLNEGTLRDQTYAGPGEAVGDGVDAEKGYLWWFKGKGLHTLKFHLIVPLRKELPSRRLQLTLPQTLISSLNLRVPVPRLTAKGDEQGRARLTLNPTADGATEIQMIGLGTRLDLTWQPQPDLGTVDTVLEARTAITATIDGRTMLLEANQRLGALQGAFTQVQVRLPRGGELLKVEGEYYKGHVKDPKDPTLAVVTLKDNVPTGTPVDLKWTVSVDAPAQSERILIEGFDVAKAKIQTGHLAIRIVGDYRLERIEGQNQFVQRDNLSTLEKAVPAFPIRDDVSSAYSILRQPFQLAFNLQPEKPHITVTPRLFLSLNADRMELFGEYDIEVYRWGIEDVKFAWPGWKDEGWKLDPVTPANQVEETKLDDPNEIQVKLIERKVGPVVRNGDRASGTEPKQFTLLLHATRMLSAGQPSQDFTLPAMPGANMAPTDFILVLADNLDADLRPLGETATKLQTVSAATPVVLPKELADRRHRDFRLDAAQAKFSVSTTAQEQKIGTQTEVELSLDGTELHIQQRITYDVTYKRMSQVVLQVPEQLLSRATFAVSADGQQTSLNPIAMVAEPGTSKPQRLSLVTPRIGKFDVIIQADLPVDWAMGATTLALDVPLVESRDAEFSATRLRIQKPKRQRLSLKDRGAGWTPQAPQNGAAVWLAGSKQSTISLECEKSDGTGRQGIAVPRRLVQAVFAPGGEVYCQAQYYLAGQASALRVTFPAGATPTNTKWGQNKVDPANIIETPPASGQYQITLPELESPESEHLLTIAYQLPKQSVLDSGQARQLAAPEVTSDGTPTQTFWQIQLPVNQHLWTLPAGFTPEFDWHRTGGWWTRVPRHAPEALEQWISGNTETESVSAMPMSGNRYLFSSLEGASAMSFHTLGAPLIVLFGASLALVMGFILVNVPSTRHVLTLLWLGFLTTLAALWYSEPVLVLLQPAGLGLVLALLASIAQRRFRKARVQPVLTLATPSDILTATSSREQAIPAVMLEDSPTQSHPPAFPMTEAGVGL